MKQNEQGTAIEEPHTATKLQVIKQPQEAVALSVEDVKQQIQQVQHLMKEAMKLDEHYGCIPGCGDKPTLLKPGAEKLCFMFRLGAEYEVFETILDKGHKEYRITCTLRNIANGLAIGQGVGLATTMESKYRYRTEAGFEETDEPIPNDYKEKKTEYRKKGQGCKKVNGAWIWVHFKDGERVENPDIADTYNTVLKIAKKRAHVDAVLTATAASDIFTQDIEDMKIKPQGDQTNRTSAHTPEPVKPNVSDDRMEKIGKIISKLMDRHGDDQAAAEAELADVSRFEGKDGRVMEILTFKALEKTSPKWFNVVYGMIGKLEELTPAPAEAPEPVVDPDDDCLPF